MDPKVRLYLIYFAALLMAMSQVILGFSLQNGGHYLAVAVLYGLQVVGIRITTTAVNAFLLDAYPEWSGEFGAFVVFGRALGGTMATHINIPWVQNAGAGTVFGIQAGITVGASLIIILLQVFRKHLRITRGPMVFSH